MGFFDFLYKVGAPGKTAETVVSQFLKIKERKPELENYEIMKLIIQARHAAIPYKPHQMAQLEELLEKKPKLFDFVVRLIEIDTDAYANINYSDVEDIKATYDMMDRIEKVVRDVFRKYEISEEAY